MIQQCWKTSRALIVAVFNLNGELVLSNKGMDELLESLGRDRWPVEYLINPDFATLSNLTASERPCFGGVMTIGNGRDKNHSIMARVFRNEGYNLMTGEYEALHADQLNRQMASLNQELNIIQRELIKERKTLQSTLDELKSAQAMLIHSAKMNAPGQLVAGIAHGINNPLSYISGNFGALRDYFSELTGAYDALETLALDELRDNDSAKARIRELCTECDLDSMRDDLPGLEKGANEGLKRISAIVTNLRTFSRLDESSFKEVNMHENLKAIVSLMTHELEKRDIAMSMEADEMPDFECSPSELNQAFLNITLNAVQAVEHDGKITLRVKNSDENIVIEVEDTGSGIAEEIKDRIFNPFFTTKPVGQGMGIGLSIAHGIVRDMHHGTIQFKSEENAGTVFIITLPRKGPATHADER